MEGISEVGMVPPPVRAVELAISMAWLGRAAMIFDARSLRVSMLVERAVRVGRSGMVSFSVLSLARR